MIYAEEYATKSEAMRAEAAFKKQTRKNKEMYLIKYGVPTPFSSRKSLVLRKIGEPAETSAKEETNEKPKKL